MSSTSIIGYFSLRVWGNEESKFSAINNRILIWKPYKQSGFMFLT